MSRTPMFLDLSAKPGPGGVKTADDIIAENSRLRDLVRRLAETLNDTVKLTPYDAIARDLLREAREALEDEQ